MSRGESPDGARLVSPTARALHPALLIVVGALLVTAGEILLKKGATAVTASHGSAAVLGIAPLASGWTWLGIVSYVLSLIAWLHVLRTVPLSVAFPLINVVQVLVPVGASVFLHERISLGRSLGIALVVLGLLAVVRPLMRAEKTL